LKNKGTQKNIIVLHLQTKCAIIFLFYFLLIEG
jgi:hypothetical protein